MRRLLLLLALGLTACPPPVPEDTGAPDTDPDTDTDIVDTDTGDTDTGDTDTGDTDTGDTDTGDTDTDPCGAMAGVEDLILRAEVRDASGPCTTCDPSGLSGVGLVENPCDVEIVLRTPSTCLVTEMRLAPDGGTALTEAPLCGDAETDHRVPPGGAVEQVLPFAGTLPSTTPATLTVTYDKAPPNTATTGITTR